MARLLLVLLTVALTVYAVADWVTRSRQWTPGNVNRWLWLAVIILLPVIGPLAWIIIGLVTRAEARGDSTAPMPADIPPDDNPEAISDVADRIARRQKRTRPEVPPRTDEDDEGKPNQSPA